MSTDSVSPYRSSAVSTRRRGWPIACARLRCICVCASSTVVVVVITEDAVVPVGEAGDCDCCWGLPPVVGPLLLFAAAAVRRTVTRRQWKAGKKSVFRSGSWRLNKS